VDLKRFHCSRAAQFFAVTAIVLLVRLPFLRQAVQGDDYYYLAGAMHALIDPAHPTHVRYVFLGQEVDARGHPHPPLNMWILAGLLAIFGDVREIPFHAAYTAFSLIAAWSMLALTRRFCQRPLLASILFLLVPAFVVNGNSFEADLPLLAFWLAAVALFVQASESGSTLYLGSAAVSLALAGLLGFQALLLIPILGWYLWLVRCHRRLPWLLLAVPLASALGWQVFERLTSGQWPFLILAGHFESFGFQRLEAKLANAVALATHAGWLVFPVLVWVAFWRGPQSTKLAALAAGLVAAFFLDSHPVFWASLATGLYLILSLAARFREAAQQGRFLVGWALIFFAAALVLFFSGSARYLLPMAAPVAMLVADRLPRERRLVVAICLVCQAGLGLALAAMNYQHWEGYRLLVAQLKDQFATHRVWVNGEWGLRFYAEAEGGLPLQEGQPVQPGEMVLTSELGYPVSFTTGGGQRQRVGEWEIRSQIPLRLIGLGARSAYSTVAFGYRPFDLQWGPIDRVRLELVVEVEPRSSYLAMSAPEADSQILSGVYQLEDGRYRWMGRRAVLLLKAPPQPATVQVVFYVPPNASARQIRASVDGQQVAQMEIPGPGTHRLRSEGRWQPAGSTARLEIVVDRTFSPPGDRRELGIILLEAGFHP